ncbi:MAG: hypothetical protein PHT12_06285, partial [Patescibacteria group bacterium]|nr:hypothetical protein [Patescibacteria group bacterium]
ASAQSTQAEQTMAAVAPTEMPAGVAETVGSDTIPATLDAEYTKATRDEVTRRRNITEQAASIPKSSKVPDFGLEQPAESGVTVEEPERETWPPASDTELPATISSLPETISWPPASERDTEAPTTERAGRTERLTEAPEATETPTERPSSAPPTERPTLPSAK